MGKSSHSGAPKSYSFSFISNEESLNYAVVAVKSRQSFLNGGGIGGFRIIPDGADPVTASQVGASQKHLALWNEGLSGK